MPSLPHGCYYSNFSVYPKNWKSVRASVKINWYIQYRFYDPEHEKPKQKFIKLMNEFKTLEERQEATQMLLDDEKHRLHVEGYNPIEGSMVPDRSRNFPINEFTPLCQALETAKDSMKVEHQIKLAMKSVLKFVVPAAESLGLHSMAVHRIKRKDIRAILSACEITKGTWKPANFNFYRAYLMMLFKEIMQYDAIENNPVQGIQKMKVIKKIRPTLSIEKRKKVDEHLKKVSYPFWRLVHIFFHSGCRTSELLNVRVEDVDLAGQRFKTLIKKGKQPIEKMRTINDQVKDLWQELLETAKADNYIFGKGLVPGAKRISSSQINRRWKRHVKDNDDLGVTEDFYSLKHLNTTQVVDLLSEEDAAALNGHSSTAMVVNIYDTAQERRRHERLKKVNNSFVDY